MKVVVLEQVLLQLQMIERIELEGSLERYYYYNQEELEEKQVCFFEV